MSAVIGSDPDQLDQLATTLFACADRLDDVRSELAVVLLGSPWRGHDAEEFRWQWGQHLAGVVQGASAAFREAGGRVRLNAAQQREASADGGGRASAPGAGGFNPLGFGADALKALGYAAGAVGLVKDAKDGLIGGQRSKDLAERVVRLADDVRVGGGVPLRIAGEALGKFAIPIDIANTLLDGKDLFDEAGENVRSAATFDAAVSTALGVAGVVAGTTGVVALAAGAAPVVAGAAAVGAGLFLGSLAWDAASEFTPAEEWLNSGFWAVADGVGAVAEAVGNGVGNIIDGGLDALLGR